MYDERIESHPWFDVGRHLEGHEAYQFLQSQRQDHAQRQRCIYVHIPFCDSICDFCALYTRAVPAHNDNVFDQYVSQIKYAIEQHPFAGQGHAPTTVHFGGGTPLHIGTQRFRTIVDHLHTYFGNQSNCEWAVETNTSSITPDTLGFLQSVGIQRIHIGIQTLDNNIRKTIGRRETGEQCLEKIQLAQQTGFFLSVDLIIGLDGMDENILLDDLQQLYAAGIRMFSICELRHRNKRAFAQCHTPQRILQNRQLWQIIWQFMQSHQLIPIHLGQFGRSYDDNRYFTHPARGEDCIAIGPYAHGSCGPLYYANKLMPGYYDATATHDGLINHATFFTPELQCIRQLESELLTHRISQHCVENMLACYGNVFHATFCTWLDNGYLHLDESGYYVLGEEGSWYVGNMINHVRHLVKQDQLNVRVLV